MTSGKPEPWERQDGETTPAFEAFAKYRDQGLTRSLTRVAQELHKSKALMGRWSRTHSWVIRAAAYDAHEDRMYRLKIREARRKAGERNLAVAAAAMQAVSKSVLRLAQSDKTMDPADIARMMDAASKLERLTLGETTENVGVASSVDPAGAPDVTALTDEERRARMDMLRRELNSRLAEHDEQQGVPA